MIVGPSFSYIAYKQSIGNVTYPFFCIPGLIYDNRLGFYSAEKFEDMDYLIFSSLRLERYYRFELPKNLEHSGCDVCGIYDKGSILKICKFLNEVMIKSNQLERFQKKKRKLYYVT